jgi:hypothetical protein
MDLVLCFDNLCCLWSVGLVLGTNGEIHFSIDCFAAAQQHMMQTVLDLSSTL